jgi:histidinol-phosphate aminotransferase
VFENAFRRRGRRRDLIITLTENTPMRCVPRESVRRLKPAVHGGVRNPDLLDFSVMVNPFPPAPEVLGAFRTADIGRYPDSSSAKLRAAIAGTYDIPAEAVLVANGTSQAFWLIVMTYLSSGEKVLYFTPGYGDYATASLIMGAEPIEYRLAPERQFLPEIGNLLETIRRERPKIVWLCNPSNPTGAYLEQDDTARILEAVSVYGGILVLDEAYIYFVTGAWNSFELLSAGNLIVSRSMTKDFGMPGLRLGYIAADPEIIEQIVPVQPPWSVNTPAQEAGIKALENLPYYRREWEGVSKLTTELAESIRGLGYPVIPTRSNFMLFRTDPSDRVVSRLAERSIVVRDCTSFGLPGYIRIGTRRADENKRLIETLRSLA